MDTPAVPTGAAIWRFRSPGYLLGHTGEAKATEDTAPASVDSAAGRPLLTRGAMFSRVCHPSQESGCLPCHRWPLATLQLNAVQFCLVLCTRRRLCSN